VKLFEINSSDPDDQWGFTNVSVIEPKGEGRFTCYLVFSYLVRV
jgi:hypothetical protein